MRRMKILGGALGNCVHVGGLHHFLKMAETEGYETISLGPAVKIDRFISEIKSAKPDIVAISYRLTPEVAESLFDELKQKIKKEKITDVRFIFGGTPPVAEIALKSGIFEKAFDGSEPADEIYSYLRGKVMEKGGGVFPDNLTDRINLKYPYPILRHHFGRPSVQETIEGVKKISESGLIDVISLGTDQNAQEFFFRPELMRKELDGAGGVAVRKPEDLKKIYEASRCGNFPIMRCYSGTNDLLKWAEMSLKTINNAWAAIPLTWYSVMDGRSQRPLAEAIKENQHVIKWYASNGVPVESNESHQWSLRDAHDSLAVTMSYLAAYNAKKQGVKHYVSQYMFNTPPGTSPQMDIAKMMAKNELINTLKGDNFDFFREVRAGIAHFSGNPHMAKGQLASSIVVSLALKPHILHVVGFSEGDHATYPEELIQSCNIAHGVLSNTLSGMIDAESDYTIINRKNELISEAMVLTDAIKKFGKDISEDPLSSPEVLALAIKKGLLDTPHFRGNPHLNGNIYTSLKNGAWHAVNEKTGNIILEKERTEAILKHQ